MKTDLTHLRDSLAEGRIIPYLGSGILAAAGAAVPSDLPTLAQALSSKVSVPHRIRNNFTAAAQYIENFKHRKTLKGIITELFSVPMPMPTLMQDLAALKLPLIVNLWYDDTMAKALDGQLSWGRIQGLSQSEHYGQWVGYYQPNGTMVDMAEAAQWQTVLYEPWGAVRPDTNFLVSDSDFVEVLTEIDIQTPIPAIVQELRKGREFLFMGCRFNDQLQRAFARQIMKRSSDQHWAIIDGTLSRNEERFLEEQGIRRLDISRAELFKAPLATSLVAGLPSVSRFSESMD